MISQELQQQVVCLTDEAGFVRLPPRCELVLRGGDRSKFLNNFCTADIEKLENGFVTELFILDTRGKTLAFGHVAKLDEDIFISTAAAEQSNELLQHLDKYIIREDVSIENRTDAIASFFISGKQHPNLLDPNFTIVQNQIRSIKINSIPCRIANIELADFGHLISCPIENEGEVSEYLESNNITRCDIESLHIKRIEYGTPWFGIEIDDSNLPQEMRRDNKAISFTKGCYLGQETVAKIDAFGHVNKFLVAIQLDGGTAVETGEQIFSDELKIGQIKSISYSPTLNSNLAMGFVKCKFADVGTQVSIGQATGTVVSLPISA